MDNQGAQRYVDQFITLAKRLHWKMDDEAVIYQFKSGLSKWLLSQISTAESNHLLLMETKYGKVVAPINVKMLAKLAIRIEANDRIVPAREVQRVSKPKKRIKKVLFNVLSVINGAFILQMCANPPKLWNYKKLPKRTKKS
jgi:hypothetical protein